VQELAAPDLDPPPVRRKVKRARVIQRPASSR
jgi:hypothetical protein